jgi:phospholipase C
MKRLSLYFSFTPAAILLTLTACGGGSSSSPTAPAYALTASPLQPASVTAGGHATSKVTVTPSNGYTGTVSLSCHVNNEGEASPLCSVSPTTAAITGSANFTLTVSTSINSPGGDYSITVTATDAANHVPSDGPQTLTLTNAAVIQHVVVIFQENRSTDNLFHDPVLISRGADIATSGTYLGQKIPLTSIDLGTVGPNPQNYDLNHSHNAFVKMYDGGKMDGKNPSCGPVVVCPPYAHPNFWLAYVDPADVQPYFALAERYTFGDRMFQTNEGPSFPAHQFILAGTSAPTATSQLFAAENASGTTANDNSPPTGCIAPPTQTVAMIDASGSETAAAAQYPCFEHPTLTDLLETDGISWRYYTPSAGSIWTAPNAIEHMCQEQAVNGVLTCKGPEWDQGVVIPQTQVLVDITNRQLAQVSWVIPNGLSSDHPSVSDGSGPSWVGSIVNAIGESPYWANTAIIITWDDWGGWYDHVAPRVVNDGISWGSGYVYGMRVPLIVVSPYAKTAYISHVTHDFGSILKFIETTFKLPSLDYADRPADDLADCFNLTQPPTTFSAIPTALDAAYFINDKRPPTDPDDD